MSTALVTTPDRLAEAEELGRLQFTNEEIAIIMDMDATELDLIMDDRTHPLCRAILRGAFLQEAKVRKSVFELAERGSSPAQNLAVTFIQRRH